MPQERLQKILAAAGAASRRGAEKLIAAGRVAVDGRVVTELGSKADPETQTVTLDGEPLTVAGLEYWLAHKPVGVVSTVSDPQGRTKVTDLLPTEAGRVVPVGRLDYDSEGLLLMTNDGELTARLLHPRYHVPKKYLVWVLGRPDEAALRTLREGVDLEDGRTAPARVERAGAERGLAKLAITVGQGKKRMVRRMCEAVGHPVKRLVRLAMGPLTLGDLPAGQARRLTGKEIMALREAAGIFSSCKKSPDDINKNPGRRRGGDTGL